MNLEDKIRDYISSNGLPDVGQRLLVGLSGGADSVCLSLLLQRLGYELHCVHCNFHLRGEESDRDEKFVRDFCRRHGMSLEVTEFDTEGYCRSRGLSIEMGARELRYDYFRTKKSELGLDYICVAHHKEDSIETFFINLLRGSGLRGLCGIQSLNGDVFRPLLSCSRKEILGYLSELGEHYVDDSSNSVPDYLRNKIRLELVPLLEDINPWSSNNILTSMDNLNEAYKIYSRSVDHEISKIRKIDSDGTEHYSKLVLESSSSPLSILHELIGGYGFSRSQLEQILLSLTGVGKKFESKSHRLTIDRDELLLESLPSEDVPPLYEELKLGDFSTTLLYERYGLGIEYHIESYSEDKIVKDKRLCYIDMGKVSGSVVLREVREGDRFCPFGMHGSKLVSDYMKDMKLSWKARRRQLVLEIGGKIVWLVCERGSELFRCDAWTKDMLVVRAFPLDDE